MKFLISAFSQSGDISMIRIMALLCCITAIMIAIISVCKPDPDYSGASLLCGAFLSIAFTGKIIQKKIEKIN